MEMLPYIRRTRLEANLGMQLHCKGEATSARQSLPSSKRHKVWQPHSVMLLILDHRPTSQQAARWCLKCLQLLVFRKHQHNPSSRPVLPLSSLDSCVQRQLSIHNRIGGQHCTEILHWNESDWKIATMPLTRHSMRGMLLSHLYIVIAQSIWEYITGQLVNTMQKFCTEMRLSGKS